MADPSQSPLSFLASVVSAQPPTPTTQTHAKGLPVGLPVSQPSGAPGGALSLSGTLPATHDPTSHANHHRLHASHRQGIRHLRRSSSSPRPSTAHSDADADADTNADANTDTDMADAVHSVHAAPSSAVANRLVFVTTPSDASLALYWLPASLAPPPPSSSPSPSPSPAPFLKLSELDVLLGFPVGHIAALSPHLASHPSTSAAVVSLPASASVAAASTASAASTAASTAAPPSPAHDVYVRPDVLLHVAKSLEASPAHSDFVRSLADISRDSVLSGKAGADLVALGIVPHLSPVPVSRLRIVETLLNPSLPSLPSLSSLSSLSSAAAAAGAQLPTAADLPSSSSGQHHTHHSHHHSHHHSQQQQQHQQQMDRPKDRKRPADQLSSPSAALHSKPPLRIVTHAASTGSLRSNMGVSESDLSRSATAANAATVATPSSSRPSKLRKRLSIDTAFPERSSQDALVMDQAIRLKQQQEAIIEARKKSSQQQQPQQSRQQPQQSQQQQQSAFSRPVGRIRAPVARADMPSAWASIDHLVSPRGEFPNRELPLPRNFTHEIRSIHPFGNNSGAGIDAGNSSSLSSSSLRSHGQHGGHGGMDGLNHHGNSNTIDNNNDTSNHSMHTKHMLPPMPATAHPSAPGAIRGFFPPPASQQQQQQQQMHSSSSSVSSKAGQRGSKTGMHGGGSAHNRPLKISTALATNSGPLPQHGVSASAAATGGNSSSTTSNSTKSASAGNLLSTGQPYTANGPSSGQPPSAFPPPAMSRQAFLGVFEAMYDQHETQLRLQATLKDQIRKSSTLLQTLQSSGQMIEGLVRLHFREMQVVYGEKFGTALTDLNRRLVGIENRLGIHASGSGGGGGAGAGSVGAVEDSANAGGTGVEDSTNAGDLDEGESAAGGGLTSMATSKGGDAADDDGRGAHARGGLDAELDGLRSRVDAAERQARSFVPSD